MSELAYTYMLRYDSDHPEGEWLIVRRGKGGGFPITNPKVRDIAARFPHEATDDGQPPVPVREAYERLIDWKPDATIATPFNVVERIADGEDCAFDQPCAYGHRVETHAVYCHNTSWLYAPVKCRRHQGPSVWGDKPWPHEGCAGFKANPRLAK